MIFRSNTSHFFTPYKLLFQILVIYNEIQLITSFKSSSLVMSIFKQICFVIEYTKLCLLRNKRTSKKNNVTQPNT